MRTSLYTVVASSLAFSYAFVLPSNFDDNAALEAVAERPSALLGRNVDSAAEQILFKPDSQVQYDERFATKQLSYDERQTVLQHLMKSYLSTMQDLGITTVLLHNTLLGWYWNNQILPWDTQLNVAVPEGTLPHLAKYYNSKLYGFPDPHGETGREYLLEIGSHVDKASLDARWIDIQTGLYIHISTLRREIATETKPTAVDEDLLRTKDHTRFSSHDIFPLLYTTFEGFSASIPRAYTDILTREFGNDVLAAKGPPGHVHDQRKRRWVGLPDAADSVD